MSKNENSEKLKALKMTIDKLEKSYGKGIVMKMDDDNIVKVDTISTGSSGIGHWFRCWWFSKRKSY